ncbi:MAG: hypothetical protein LUO93_08435 [Methanomicrobiales archaeon]|nr:hypothetical protein [Methanomicrobiales archaeon]
MKRTHLNGDFNPNRQSSTAAFGQFPPFSIFAILPKFYDFSKVAIPSLRPGIAKLHLNVIRKAVGQDAVS